MKIDGQTRLCGLIGNPVGHTLSPVIHNTLAMQCGINLVYMPLQVEKEQLGAAVSGAHALNVLGLNVTVPYKRDVIPYLDDIDPLADALQSVNTLVRTSGGFKGFNTDMSGLYRAMTEDGVTIKDAPVIVLGAGGVGGAVAHLCAQKGARRVWLLNRSPEKARRTADEVNTRAGRGCVKALALSDWRKISDGECLAIQATSVGLYPDCDRAVLEDEAFYRQIHTGYDLIYRPADTKFMRNVRKVNGRAFNGLKMLVYQGVEAFEKWNGVSVTQEQAAEVYGLLKRELAL